MREAFEFSKEFIQDNTVVYYRVNFGDYLLFHSRFAKSVIYIEPDILVPDKPQRVIRFNNIKTLD